MHLADLRWQIIDWRLQNFVYQRCHLKKQRCHLENENTLIGFVIDSATVKSAITYIQCNRWLYVNEMSCQTNTEIVPVLRNIISTQVHIFCKDRNFGKQRSISQYWFTKLNGQTGNNRKDVLPLSIVNQQFAICHFFAVGMHLADLR